MMHVDHSLTASAQRLMLEAGHQPKDDWLYIEDLVREYRSQYEQRQDLVANLDAMLADSGGATTRAEFKRYCATVNSAERRRRNEVAQEERLNLIYKQCGVLAPDTGHVALALRILELESAVKTYSDRVRAMETEPKESKSSGIIPFAAGVAIGGALF